MKKCKTWQAQIYCGLRKGYSEVEYPIQRAEEICKSYVKSKGWVVSLTSTKFFYKDGCENGVTIGIIQYPRFPYSIKELESRTMELADLLKIGLDQIRVSVVFPDETIMLE